MQKVIFSLIMCTCFATILSAQQHSKLERVIQLIELSDFTYAYKQAKKEIEAEVFSFKQKQHFYAPMDVAVIQKGYDDHKIEKIIIAATITTKIAT